jgi:hypothetical protein
MGVALLAGHLQPIFYLGVVLAGLVILTVIQRVRGEDLPSHRARHFPNFLSRLCPLYVPSLLHTLANLDERR